MAQKGHGPARDTYQEIADLIVAALDAGTVPWARPWDATRVGALRNGISSRPYSGINVLILGATSLAAGYSDPRWVTFRQALSAGGHVRKGEHGTRIVFWRFVKGEKDEHGRERTIPLLRTFVVFNVAQCEGLELDAIEAPAHSWNPLEEAERVARDYIARAGLDVRHVLGDRAYYTPALDTLTMPDRGQFRTADAYYSTLFHELGHSTGHTSRLGRLSVEAGIAPFGSPDYGREELVAEFASAFVAGATGIACEHEIQQSAAYIAGWRRAIVADPRAVVVAAGKAQKAADLILGREADAGEEED
jgi:antirestriction protein ArdC